jgi:transposase
MKGYIMQTVTTIGLDLAKSVLQVHGVDEKGFVVIRRALRRSQVLDFFSAACRRAWSGSKRVQAPIIGRGRSVPLVIGCA